MFQNRVFLDRLQEQIRHQFRWNRQPLYEIRIRMYETESYLFDERFNKWNIGLLGTASNWWRHSRRCFTLSSAMELKNFFIQIIVLSDVGLDLFVFLAIFLLNHNWKRCYKCSWYLPLNGLFFPWVGQSIRSYSHGLILIPRVNYHFYWLKIGFILIFDEKSFRIKMNPS